MEMKEEKFSNNPFDPELFREEGHKIIDLLSDYLKEVTARPDTPVLPWTDPDELTDVYSKVLERGAAEPFTEYIGEAVRRSNHMTNDEDEVIGSSWMTFDGRRIHLHHFGILPSYQGRGLSKPLLERSLDFVKSKGYQVKLEVHKSNKKAIELYKKYGFKYLGDYDVYIIRDLGSD